MPRIDQPRRRPSPDRGAKRNDIVARRAAKRWEWGGDGSASSATELRRRMAPFLISTNNVLRRFQGLNSGRKVVKAAII